MKRLLATLLVLLGVWARADDSAHIVVSTMDLMQQRLANRPVTLNPISPVPRTLSTNLFSRMPRTLATGTNGVCTFSNTVWGLYRLDISGTPITSFYLSLSTNFSGLISAAVLVTNAAAIPPDPSTNYYTMSQIDAYITSILGLTNPIVQVAAGSNIVVITNSATLRTIHGTAAGGTSNWSDLTNKPTPILLISTNDGSSLTNLNASSLASGTVALARLPAGVSNNWINALEEFGMDRSGATDSTDELNAALLYASTNGTRKTVFVPSGQYLFVPSLGGIVMRNGVTLMGDERYNTQFKYAGGTFTNSVLRAFSSADGNANTYDTFTIENLNFVDVQPAGPEAFAVIDLTGTRNAVLRQIGIIGDVTAASSNRVGILFSQTNNAGGAESCFWVKIEDSQIQAYTVFKSSSAPPIDNTGHIIENVTGSGVHLFDYQNGPPGGIVFDGGYFSSVAGLSPFLPTNTFGEFFFVRSLSLEGFATDAAWGSADVWQVGNVEYKYSRLQGLAVPKKYVFSYHDQTPILPDAYADRFFLSGFAITTNGVSEVNVGAGGALNRHFLNYDAGVNITTTNYGTSYVSYVVVNTNVAAYHDLRVEMVNTTNATHLVAAEVHVNPAGIITNIVDRREFLAAPTFRSVISTNFVGNGNGLTNLSLPNIAGAFSNGYSGVSLYGSNVFQVQTTNATLGLAVGTNGGVYVTGTFRTAGAATLGNGSQLGIDGSFGRSSSDVYYEQNGRWFARSDGDMIFGVDVGNNDSTSMFVWKKDSAAFAGGTTNMLLDQSGNLTLFGTVTGNGGGLSNAVVLTGTGGITVNTTDAGRTWSISGTNSGGGATNVVLGTSSAYLNVLTNGDGNWTLSVDFEPMVPSANLTNWSALPITSRQPADAALTNVVNLGSNSYAGTFWGTNFYGGIFTGDGQGITNLNNDGGDGLLMSAGGITGTATTSSDVAGKISDEQGTGKLVFNTNATMTALGVTNNLTLNGAAINTWDDVTNFFAQTGTGDSFWWTNSGAASSISNAYNVKATSFTGSGAGLTSLTAANIAAGTAGINISGNANTATTATTANSGDSATAFFPSGTIEPARLATNAAANALILKATSSTTAAWSSEAAGPTNIVNDGQYVWLTGTNATATSGSSLRLGQTQVLMRLNGGALVLADEATGVVDYYGVDSSDGISITNNANGGGIGLSPASPNNTVYIKGNLNVSGSSSFSGMAFTTATFTNAIFKSNQPPATISPGNGAVVFNSNNAALYYVLYNNAGNPTSTNAFGGGTISSAWADVTGKPESIISLSTNNGATVTNVLGAVNATNIYGAGLTTMTNVATTATNSLATQLASLRTNLANLTVTNGLIATNVAVAGFTNNGTGRVNGALTVTGTLTTTNQVLYGASISVPPTNFLYFDSYSGLHLNQGAYVSDNSEEEFWHFDVNSDFGKRATTVLRAGDFYTDQFSYTNGANNFIGIKSNASLNSPNMTGTANVSNLVASGTITGNASGATNIPIASIVSPGAILTNGLSTSVTVSNAILSQSTSASAPAATELATAGWVRGLFDGAGVTYYNTTNTSASFTNAGAVTTNNTFFLYNTSQPTYYSIRTYLDPTNGSYIGFVTTTNKYQQLNAGVVVNAMLSVDAGGTGTGGPSIKPEIYLSYDGTNWLGDWSGTYQNIPEGSTNLYSWVVANPSYATTNATGFYVMRAFKVGTQPTPATSDITLHVGTNATVTTASHLSIPGITTGSGNAFLAANQSWSGSNNFAGNTTFALPPLGSGAALTNLNATNLTGNAASALAAINATNFWGTLSTTNLPATFSATSAANATNFWGTLSTTNLPATFSATSAANATNFWGTLNATNYGTRYEEVWVPANAMWPGTNAGPAAATNTWATTTDGQTIEAWDFDADAYERVQFTYVMPENWNAGTVNAKFYWRAVNGTVLTNVWAIQGGGLGAGDVAGNSLGSVVLITNVPSDAITKVNISSWSPALTLGSNAVPGNLTWFMVHRSTNTWDTLTNDARLFGIKLKYAVTNAIAAP